DALVKKLADSQKREEQLRNKLSESLSTLNSLRELWLKAQDAVFQWKNFNEEAKQMIEQLGNSLSSE
ncbi:MAG TPA: hypothetical protein DEA58_02035, partial [Pseudothermotoga sp.]|nr:hypothetical protein [Pseudothermotoga sp.]